MIVQMSKFTTLTSNQWNNLLYFTGSSPMDGPWAELGSYGTHAGLGQLSINILDLIY